MTDSNGSIPTDEEPSMDDRISILESQMDIMNQEIYLLREELIGVRKIADGATQSYRAVAQHRDLLMRTHLKGIREVLDD